MRRDELARASGPPRGRGWRQDIRRNGLLADSRPDLDRAARARRRQPSADSISHGGEISVSIEAVLWRGEEPLDATLLAADHPESGRWIERTFVGPIDRNQTCESMGFAKVGRKSPLDESVAGGRFELSGTLHPPINDNPVLLLHGRTKVSRDQSASRKFRRSGDGGQSPPWSALRRSR